MTTIQKDQYRYILKEAIADYEAFGKELRRLEEETDEVNDARAKLRRTITALAALCGESPYFDPLGITDSCMEAMAEEMREVSTTDVVKTLENMGFDFSSQKNPAASVHTVLSRLADKGKITKGDDASTITWRGPKFGKSEIPDKDIEF